MPDLTVACNLEDCPDRGRVLLVIEEAQRAVSGYVVDCASGHRYNVQAGEVTLA